MTTSPSHRQGAWATALLLTVVLAACRAPTPPRVALTETHPLLERIWDVRAGRFVSEATLLAALADRRHVLLGEKHDNPRHHQLQARVLQGLVTAGRRPALVWEMITERERPALQAHLAKPRHDAAELGLALAWDERGWPSWQMYEPIARVALRARLPWVAGGVPRGELMKFAHASLADGQGAAHAAEAGPSPLRLPQPVADALAKSLEGAHCGHANKAMVRMMVLVQQLKDRFMAEGLVQAGEGRGSVLIAGKGHVRRDHGVPFFLQQAHSADGPQIASVAFMEVAAEHAEPRQYALRGVDGPAFDYVWFTERVDSVDPCDKYRDQLRKMSHGQRRGTADGG